MADVQQSIRCSYCSILADGGDRVLGEPADEEQDQQPGSHHQGPE